MEPREDAVILEHCRRVAAVAQCIGHQQFLETETKRALYEAALRHHDAAATVEPLAVRRIVASFQAGSDEYVPVQVLRLAEAYDTLYRASASQPMSAREILEALRARSGAGAWQPAVIESLASVMRESAVPYAEVGRLPVFRAAALRVSELLENRDASLPDIEEAAAADPAIAASVMRAANSALFSGRDAVTSLRRAVLRLGFENTRRVLVSAILRPVFASASLAPLLPHSAEAADLAAQIARRTGAANVEEAFLCGLLHDLGKLCLDHFNLFDSARMRGLLEHGCPEVYAENLLLGQDHGAIGGRVAASWYLPFSIAAAIRFHHVPEQTHSVLAHILYLVEWLLGHEQDVPAPARLEHCLASIGLSQADLGTIKAGGLHQLLVA